MGWNSWNYFAEKVDDKAVRDAADAAGFHGNARCWLHLREHRRHLARRTRRAGRTAREQQIPGYESARRLRSFQGTEDRHLLRTRSKDLRRIRRQLSTRRQDAKMYADWGIDYLKYDLCSFIPDVMEKQAPGRLRNADGA